MDTILITGGNGLIGKHLSKVLRAKGYHISILSRTTNEAPNVYFWDIGKNFIEPKAIQEANYIIHLAGAGIADERWTNKRKKELVNSRVESTKLLYENVLKLNPNLKGFIAASGIGYYGTVTSVKIMTENDPPGNDFLAKTCMLWEQESLKFDAINIRTVILRTGVVLTEQGGALEKLIKPIKLGMGAILGTGKQYVPWIHINDICNMYVEAIENKKIHGIYNAVAPEHITNTELTKNIAAALHKKIRLPNIPSLVLKAMLGKMAVVLLEGSRISCEKIEKEGFQFQFPKLNNALKHLLKI